MLRHFRQLAGRAGSREATGRGEFAVVAALSAVAVGAIALRVDLYTIGTAAFADPGWDRHLYLEMASRGLGDFQIAPYCWRILVPWLARVQPWTVQSGFLTISLVALMATGPVLYGLLRSTGASASSGAALVVLFFSLGWAVRYPAADFWVPDATAMLFTTTTMWLIVAKRWKLAALTMAVGVLSKESVLFVAPLAFSWHARSLVDWEALRRALAVAVPAALVLLLVRMVVSPRNGDAEYLGAMPPAISRFPELFHDYSYTGRLQQIGLDERWAHRQWADFDRYLFDPFGLPMLLLALVGAAQKPERLLRLVPFLVLVYSQLLFATDTQRLLVLGVPALAILAAGGADHLAQKFRLPAALFVVAFAGLFALSLFDPNDYGSPLLIQSLLVGGGAVAVLVAVTLRRFGDGAAKEPPPQSQPPR